MDQAEHRTSLARIPKGFKVDSSAGSLLLRSSKTSLPISSAVAVSDWLWLLACMYCGIKVIEHWSLWLALAIHILVLWPLGSRAQRGSENLTHEASHYNLAHRRKSANDFIGNWLCSYWVLISVGMFRTPHMIHHKKFGSDTDPDKKRFLKLDLDRIRRDRKWQFALQLSKTMPMYVQDYWRQFGGKKGQLAISALLHFALVVIVSCFINKNFWLYWLVYFWIPFLFYLPVLRFIAEAEEHRYFAAKTEFESTFSNLGRFQRWFLHPHGDAYHLLHHMEPQIPHWRLSRVHKELSKLDLRFCKGKYRTSIFQDTDDKNKRSQT